MNKTLNLAKKKPKSTEKSEQRLIDDLILRMGGSVVNLSQPRHSMLTIGLPDRRYRVLGVAFWWETKSDHKEARLSEEQFHFLISELSVGSLAGCGALNDIVSFIQMIRDHLPVMGKLHEEPPAYEAALNECFRRVNEYADRGFRQRRNPHNIPKWMKS